MKRNLLIIFLLLLTCILHAQKDTSIYASTTRYISGESPGVNLSIYPVPVRNNTFNIKTDRDVSFVKITNIIGQDIFRSKYSAPQQFIKINLENPQRGMYLVTVLFTDGSRVAKKIMIEESK